MLTPRLTLALALVLCCAAPGRGQFGGTPVVVTGVNYAGLGTFSNFVVRPSISGLNTAFGATAASGAPVLAVSTPPALIKIADPGTLVPGGAGNFVAFNTAPIGLSGGVYAFQGNGAPIGPMNFGLFSNATGGMQPVATLNTPYPTGGFFTNHTAPTLSGTTVAFAGTNAPGGMPLGVFTRTGGGPLVTVATNSSPAPGGGTFIDFSDPANGASFPSISGSNVFFNGRTTAGGFGIYSSNGFGVGAIATNSTVVPGATGGTFSSFGTNLAVSGANVAFRAVGSGRQGVYRSVGGVLSRVADTTTTVPGTALLFSSFLPTDVAMSGDRVAFRGTSGGLSGIYTDLSGTLQKVIATGDALDGKTVSNVNIGHYAFEGNTIAVMVAFSNGSGGIYRFSPVPEPTGVLALGLAGALAVRLRRKPHPGERGA